jgi:hypothetical protein
LAVTEFTEKNFEELTGSPKNTYSFLRLFNILLDEDRITKFMNIFRSYVINEDVFTSVNFYNTYEVANGEFWDNIAYNLYENQYLWWIVALVNNVTNPFEELEDGQILNVLREEYIYILTKDLEKVAED